MSSHTIKCVELHNFGFNQLAPDVKMQQPLHCHVCKCKYSMISVPVCKITGMVVSWGSHGKHGVFKILLK